MQNVFQGDCFTDEISKHRILLHELYFYVNKTEIEQMRHTYLNFLKHLVFNFIFTYQSNKELK